MPVFMQNKAQLLTKELAQAVDIDNNVIDEARVLEIIVELESTVLTTEDLRVTRLGRHINDIRRKTSNAEISRRAKQLVKAWRGSVNEAQKQDNSYSSNPVSNFNGDSVHSSSSASTCKPDVSSRKRPLAATSESDLNNVDKKPPPLPKLVLLLNGKVNGTTPRCISRPVHSPSSDGSQSTLENRNSGSRPMKVSTTLDLLAKIQADNSAFKEAYEISRQQAIQQQFLNESLEKPRKRMRRTKKSTVKNNQTIVHQSFDINENVSNPVNASLQRIGDNNGNMCEGYAVTNEKSENYCKSNDEVKRTNPHDSDDASSDESDDACDSFFKLCPDQDIVTKISPVIPPEDEASNDNVKLKSDNDSVKLKSDNDSVKLKSDNDSVKLKSDDDNIDNELTSTLIKPSIFGGVWDPDYVRIMTESNELHANSSDISSLDSNSIIKPSRIQSDSKFKYCSKDIEHCCRLKVLPYVSSFSPFKQDEIENVLMLNSNDDIKTHTM